MTAATFGAFYMLGYSATRARRRLVIWKEITAGLTLKLRPAAGIYGSTEHICAGQWEQFAWGHLDAAFLDHTPSGTRVGERGYFRRSGIRGRLGTAELVRSSVGAEELARASTSAGGGVGRVGHA